MSRIYFDKQIFSHLFKGIEPKYIKLFLDIKSDTQSTFCYSHGHLLDLKNDSTDIKYRELDFMEEVVKDNYLCFNTTESKANCYLAKPSEAFEDIDVEEEAFDFKNLFNVDTSLATSEQQEQIAKFKEILTKQKIDFGLENLGDLTDEISGALKFIYASDKPSMNLLDWADHFMGLLKSFEEDKSIYKGLRKIVDENINNGKFTLDIENTNFNESLKNSVIQKSFVDYVLSNLNPNGDKEITQYDFFINAYFTLDLLGISKEPSKKVKFNNVLNDGYHGYYGAFCDYVVSDDLGFLKKTKAMYKLLNIETKVLSIDEFLRAKELGITRYHDTASLFESVLMDLANGSIMKSESSPDLETMTVELEHNYLGYFNKIEWIKEGDRFAIALYENSYNYSNFVFYREYEKVINNAIKIFGIDSNSKGEFNWPMENTEIKTGNWTGRFWKYDEFSILIKNGDSSGEFGLYISNM